jgi:hypothetical protein
LIFWAKQDGWRFPGGGKDKGKAQAATKPAEAPADPEGAEAPTGYALILQHFKDYYEPAFRRAGNFYSARWQKEVNRTEACHAPGIELARQLATASDAPRDRHGVDPSRLHRFFKDWAPSAYKDLLTGLPGEEENNEVSDHAREEFRAKVAGALLTLVPLSYAYRDGDGEDRVEVQRRPLIDWARLFAKKTGKWESVRGYRLWSKLEGEPPQLAVALRVELFRQAHCADLAHLSARHFSDLCALYDVGLPCRVKGGSARALELAPGFLADLLAGPEQRPEQTQETQTDGRSDIRARYTETPFLRPSQPEDETPQGDGHDVDPGRRPQTQGENTP